ncbi:MAG: threonine/serine dehydratase [Rhodospirillaceae bacterium]|nr:threonine/serine dehydratase [Rhodospirillaceae bacterium]
MSASTLPTFADVEAAARRLHDNAVTTPLLRAPALDQHLGAAVLLKAEPLQRTGSFKFRGAFNRLAQLTPAERRAGVVAWSSGNHAQGVAAAAAILGVPATIVMPADAPAIKIDNTRRLGAAVVTYNRVTEDREAIGRRIAAERGAVIVPPYNDPHVIAGQGTVGLELMAQARAMDLAIDDVIVPASGGGLVAGVGLAVRHANPAARVYTAEPEGYDDHRRSLEAGSPQRNLSTAGALCDALLAPTPGALTWALNAQVLAGGYAVSDADVRRAMRFSFESLKLVVEPGGAAGLAAVLAGRHTCAGRTVAVVLSGGNVDSAVFSACLGD